MVLWALLDEADQLLGAGGDDEQAGRQARVGADLGVEVGCSLGVVEQPDDLGVVAVLSLLGAGVQMSLVLVALGQEAGGVLGGQVDLEQPVVLLTVLGGGDRLQVGSEPVAGTAQATPGAPAVRLGAQQAEVPAGGVGSPLDDQARLGDGQGVGQEGARGLAVAVTGGLLWGL